MKASDLFVKALENEGVTRIFAVPGEENLDVVESLRGSSIQLVVTRHEQSAAFMAATHGRLTGTPGVCMATLGPGALNLVTGAAYAKLGAMPMVLITGQKAIMTSRQARFQIVDIVATMRPLTKASRQIVSGASIPTVVRDAFRLAAEERPGPVHLELPIEEISKGADGDLWFQLYVVHRNLAKSLVSRARAANYSTLILTTDVAVNGFRERDLRNGFAMPFRITPRGVLDGISHPRWLWSYLTNGMPQLKNFATDGASDTASQAAVLRREMDASFGWDDLRRLRDEWPGKLLVKGIVTAEDAKRCVEIGADGVIVSNHGGRQPSDLSASIDALPSIADRSLTTDLILDSGIRRGADVVKAVALGATAVMLGRATLYGLSAKGEAGVSDVVAMIKEEIDRTLALIGSSSIKEVNRSCVARRPV